MKLIRSLITLAEASADDQTIHFDTKSAYKAAEIVNKYCTETKWMLNEDKKNPLCFRRGSNRAYAQISAAGIASVDSLLTTRKSENTSNWYTVILDNIPSRKYFPKRAKSFIASTDRLDRSYGKTCWILPFNESKVGFTHKDDLWETRIDIFGSYNVPIYSLNDRLFERLSAVGLQETWEGLVAFDKKLKSGDKLALLAFQNVCRQTFGGETLSLTTDVFQKYRNKFLEEIERAYSNTGQTWKQASEVSSLDFAENQEVWIEGKMLFMTDEGARDLREALGMNSIITHDSWDHDE